MSEGSRPLLAAVWMTGGIVSFSTMAVAGRALSDELSSFEIMTYRSLIGLVVVLVFGLVFRKLGDIKVDNLRLHGLRNLAHFTGQNLWFTALPLISLAQLFALEFTSPIWVLVFAVVFAGERPTRVRLAAVFLGFLGAMIVARPGFGGDPFGLSLAALSAIAFAGSIVTTRMLTRTETTFCILFWLTLMQAFMGLVTTLWDGQITWPALASWPWVIMIGFAGLIAHTCLTNALSVAPASVVTPMDFLRLPTIAVVGAVFYAEALNIWVAIGAALIFLGIYINILFEHRASTA